ncbi:glycosyltransferase family 2 protein [Paenibacillus aurantius]|uniref:Glycosyltransferase family 2 protein n=1 Tax=Paenibacillus aurantius TaxID=2918900 RepID=A0AA96RGS0_9BACL|nr:glycosyltransferase family 2 protein [Paenibacillus aurantius]WNQ10349.1 glycosyltransferase family 2 protein [Paenibacillus aurantius]
MLDNFLLVLQVVLALIGGYQLLLSFFGWYRRKTNVQHAPQKTFAVLVAAHNEEQVVGALIENLKNLDYPKELYDVFVICDNCTDNTADIVRQHGVYAFERHNASLRGKGYAIEWMLKELWKLPKSYDAVVMFDADNLVDVDYLRHMNNDLCSGSKVIQAYLDTKNPHDSWITSAYAITYWYCNRLWQLPRTNLGLANYLGGTGMCFDTQLLKEMGWGATSLVEDLEFTMRCVMRGVKPTFNYEAKVYDEKPLSFKASAKQRLRWMQGHFDVARRYFFPLFWQGLKERNWSKIDTAVYALNVYNVLLGSLCSIVLWINKSIPGITPFKSLFEMAPLVFIFVTIASVVQFPIALIIEKAPARIWKSLITFPVFMLSWWPVTLYAFFTQNNKQWSHTEHTRVIRLEEVQSKQAS